MNHHREARAGMRVRVKNTPDRCREAERVRAAKGDLCPVRGTSMEAGFFNDTEKVN